MDSPVQHILRSSILRAVVKFKEGWFPPSSRSECTDFDFLLELDAHMSSSPKKCLLTWQHDVIIKEALILS